MDLTRGAIGPNYSLDQVQYDQGNPVNETKEGSLPKEQTLLKRLGANHQGHKVEG